MSETPTNYDLVQDARIGPMEQILSQAAEPPTGVEFSYPVVGQAVSSSMWQWITKGVGNGIIDLGDGPYMLTGLDNATNTGVLKTGTGGTANAVMEGFYHQLSEDMTVSLPMPSSGTTTYSVCLTYDPRNNDSAGGPISVQVYSGTPPTTFGRVHVVLWTVRRSANQLLADATAERYRPRVAPVIYVWDETHKPDPAQQLWGTLCVVGATGSIYRSTAVNEAGGDSGERAWVSITSPPWKDLPVAASRTASIPTQYRIVGDRVELRGRVSDYQGRVLYPGDTPHNLVVLPAEASPSRGQLFAAAGNGAANPVFMKVSVQTDGSVVVFPSSGMTYVDLGSVGPIYLR